MSYEKVKSVKIDDKENKVFITSAVNNLRPLSYEKWESQHLSKILEEFGKRAVEIEIFKSYENGNFQGGSNKYTKALKVLRYALKEEYEPFNWHIDHGEYESEERKAYDERRISKEFEKLLRKALDFKLPKEKWVITKKHYDGTKIYGKKCPTCMSWEYSKEKATKYDFEKEARDNIFEKYKNDWGVELI